MSEDIVVFEPTEAWGYCSACETLSCWPGDLADVRCCLGCGREWGEGPQMVVTAVDHEAGTITLSGVPELVIRGTIE